MNMLVTFLLATQHCLPISYARPINSGLREAEHIRMTLTGHRKRLLAHCGSEHTCGVPVTVEANKQPPSHHFLTVSHLYITFGGIVELARIYGTWEIKQLSPHHFLIVSPMYVTSGGIVEWQKSIARRKLVAMELNWEVRSGVCARPTGFMT